ncbi:restriction endonuclease subunit S [Staphylococcus aureus]|nr:restriction endonuclease subunit S [Staphylococcus aureus]
MSNTQKKNVPELRFPGFEGEWEEKKLGEVAKIYDGTHQTPKYTNEGIKFLSVENIKTLNSNKYISEEAFEKEFKIRPEFGDILMTRIGDIGTPNIVSSNEKFAYYVSLALLKTKNLNSYFLKNLILSSSIQNELWRKTLHVAFPKKINKNEIGKIKINYPKKQEQQKIGQFFSKLDRQIELEEQKLELLQQQKKGYMQKIFSQELRFKDENGEDYPDWKEKKLEDIIKVNSGKDYKHLDNGDIPVYGTGGYMTSVSEPLSEIDAVGIGRKGTINKPYLLEAPFWTVDTLFYCTPKKEADILFILSLFREINWKVYDESTGVPSLSKQTINKINRFVPTNKEQQKIGQFFKKIDNKIKIQKQVIELLKKRKKTLLQKMFI